MRRTLSALAAVAGLAMLAMAQTESQGQVKAQGATDKLWRIETTGIGG